MTQTIPDEVVDRVRNMIFQRGTHRHPPLPSAVRAALENSGMVFLTHKEREAVCLCIDYAGATSTSNNELLKSALEKLS